MQISAQFDFMEIEGTIMGETSYRLIIPCVWKFLKRQRKITNQSLSHKNYFVSLSLSLTSFLDQNILSENNSLNSKILSINEFNF